MTLANEVLARLAQPLDPKRVKKREGGGGRSLSYLEGHDVMRTANDIFEIGGWGYTVAKLECIGEEPFIATRNGQTKEGVRVAYRAEVQVNIIGLTSFSDVGYGDAIEYTGSRLTPHELASKEAVTDGLKRALKNLGDQFGLCLYDKSAPEHEGRSSAPAGPPQGRAKAGAVESEVAAAATTPAPGSFAVPPEALRPTDKQLGYLRKLMDSNGIDDVGRPLDTLTKGDASLLIEQLKAGTFNPPELAAAGAGFINDDPDSDVPF